MFKKIFLGIIALALICTSALIAQETYYSNYPKQACSLFLEEVDALAYYSYEITSQNGEKFHCFYKDCSYTVNNRTKEGREYTFIVLTESDLKNGYFGTTYCIIIPCQQGV